METVSGNVHMHVEFRPDSTRFVACFSFGSGPGTFALEHNDDPGAQQYCPTHGGSVLDELGGSVFAERRRSVTVRIPVAIFPEKGNLQIVKRWAGWPLAYLRPSRFCLPGACSVRYH